MLLEDYAFSVVDVETTGLFARGRDRIVEIAVVRLDRTGEPKTEFVTLVNPGRDIGPTRIHGITARDIIRAPSFSEIAGDVAALLAGAVFVAHNVRFDADFIEAELGRVTKQQPPLATLCTMTMARRIDEAAPSYRLGALCEHLGLPRPQGAHSALDDARATALLFGALLRRAVDAGVSTLQDLGCSCEPAPAEAWPRLPRGGAVLTRQRAGDQAEPSYLARLVSMLQAEPIHRDPNTLEYVDLLDRVLEDRVVTEDEAEGLFQTAMRWGLSRDRILSIHRSYLEALTCAALADGVITSTEREDLELVTRLFGYDVATLDAMLSAGPSRQPLRSDGPGPNRGSLARLSVCFTGDSRLTFQGEHLTRVMAEELASKAGLVVKGSVAKGLDLLVVVDAHSLSGKAQMARRYGTRIMAEKVFWDTLDVPMT